MAFGAWPSFDVSSSARFAAHGPGAMIDRHGAAWVHGQRFLCARGRLIIISQNRAGPVYYACWT